MTREEAIEILKGYTKDNFLFINELKEVIKVLEQPPTLAEFLGWRENVEYETTDNIYKIIDGELRVKDESEEDYFMYADRHFWKEDIRDLRFAQPVEPKKYWLVNEEMGKRLFNCLNLTEGEICFASKTETEGIQTQFTKPEIDELAKKYPKTIASCELVEVTEK